MAAIIAAGMARFGDRWDKDEAALVKEDLEDLKNVSSINAEEVFLANISYPLIRKNQSLQKSVSELTGIPIVHSFSEECGGSIALQQAAEAIDSGRIRKALVIGVDKMSDLTSSEIGYISALSLREEWQNRGLTLAAAYALLENLYLEKYSKKSDEMHALPVSAHEHGSRNKNAQFQNMISAEQVAQSALTAEPIRQLECADWCDGAAALLLVSNKEAESHDKPVYLKEHAQITAASALEKGETLIPAIQKAIGNIKTAVQEADIFELHDIFSFGEVMCIESLGCCNPGEGLQWIEKNKKRINTGGGLKACGYVPSANGLRQAAEIMLQLKNSAGERQVKNAKSGISVNLNGTGEKAAINVFSVEK